jgi:hypothetical protein
MMSLTIIVGGILLCAPPPPAGALMTDARPGRLKRYACGGGIDCDVGRREPGQIRSRQTRIIDHTATARGAADGSVRILHVSVGGIGVTMCMRRVAHTVRVARIAQTVACVCDGISAVARTTFWAPPVASSVVPVMPEPASVIRPSAPAPFMFSRQASKRPPRLGRLNVAAPSPAPPPPPSWLGRNRSRSKAPGPRPN